jgi:hypothetical protein
MASIFALGKNPTFKANVGLPQAGGPNVDVSFTFKYRTKKELDAFDASIEGKSNVEVILDMAEGWGFDEPFTAENIEEMLQRSIGSGVAIHQKYKSELVKVRLGN